MKFNTVSCPICGHIVEYDEYHKAYMCTKADCFWQLKIDDNYLQELDRQIRAIILKQKTAFTSQDIFDECRKENLIHPVLRHVIKCKLDVLEDSGIIYYREGAYRKTIV